MFTGVNLDAALSGGRFSMEGIMAQLQNSMRASMAALFIFGAAGAKAATVITFDSLSTYETVTTQYLAEGALFGGAPYVLTAPYYDYFDYPPFSEPNVIVSDSGEVDITAVGGRFASFGAWATTGTELTETAYDASNNVVATVSLSENLGTNAFLNIAGDIARVSFTGEADYFTLDNVTYTLVPEPSTWAMMLLSFASLGYVASRRRPAVAAG
jgi:PEP-CTERM motif